MNLNQQQQQNNIPRFPQHIFNCYVQKLENRIRSRPELMEDLYKLDMAEEHTLQILRKMKAGAYDRDLNPSPSTPSLRPVQQFFNSDPLQRTTVNSIATPAQTTPHSPRFKAFDGTYVPAYNDNYYSAASRNLNLQENLFDNHIHTNNDQIFQNRFCHFSTAEDYYINHYQPNRGQHVINSPNSSSYNNNNNGIGSSGMLRRETSSPLQYNADYYHRRRSQYQTNGRLAFSSMEDVRGNVVMAAKDQRGSRFLQEMINQGNPDNVDIIFSETKRSFCSLMMHQFGFRLVQKVIDVVDVNKLDEILRLLTGDPRQLGQICADDYGTKVMKLVPERLRTPEQQSLLVSAMSRIVLSLTKTANGNSVISECLEQFLPDSKKVLLHAIASYCLEIAQDKCGCHMLQKCFDAADEEIFNRLGAAIIQNADTLSENCYGNYVVQHLIEKKKLEVNRKIARKFRGKFVGLSMNKHGSNVVETLLRDSGLDDVADQVVIEILKDDFPPKVYQDQYANYVVQSLMKVIREGPLFDAFMKDIDNNRRYLQNYMCGKKVLQARELRLNQTNG